MNDIIFQTINSMNIPQLIAIGGMIWFFYSRLDGKINDLKEDMNRKFEKVDQRFEKVDQRFEKVDQRFDKIEEKLLDIDRRLCRLEGAFSSKDCCMIKDHVKVHNE